MAQVYSYKKTKKPILAYRTPLLVTFLLLMSVPAISGVNVSTEENDLKPLFHVMWGPGRRAKMSQFTVLF